MRLIRELTEDLNYVTEEKDGRKYLYVEGPYISVNAPNRNNRIYSKAVMEPVVASFIKDKVENKTAFGQFGHPASPKIEETNISHRIVSLRWDGDHVVGKAVVLDEGAPGRLMSNIINTGGRVGMSTRGMGSVKPNDKGLQEVQADYKLVTVDCVVDPSGQGCVVDGIMEGAEFIWDEKYGWKALEFIEEQKKEIHKTFKRFDEAKTLEVWSKFVKFLSEK